MRYTRWMILSLCVGALLLGSHSHSTGKEQKKRTVKPLSLEGLMDETLPNAPAEPVNLLVDNSACYVCHDNYQTEELVVVHGKEETGCIDCHGESLDHRNDEDNITPPDIMFPLDAVKDKCWECHDEHNVEATDVIARWKERCPDKTDPNTIVCTDCHFQHRIERRTVQWNKTTGELIVREMEPQDADTIGEKPAKKRASRKTATDNDVTEMNLDGNSGPDPTGKDRTKNSRSKKKRSRRKRPPE